MSRKALDNYFAERERKQRMSRWRTMLGLVSIVFTATLLWSLFSD